MKLKSFIALALCAAIPAICSAKKPKKVETEEAQKAPVEVAEPEAEPTITEECVINVSLFTECVQNKKLKKTKEQKRTVYTTCPNANKAIYTQGSKIVEWMYKNATDEAEKDRLRRLLLEMSDKRIKYFGDDPK